MDPCGICGSKEQPHICRGPSLVKEADAEEVEVPGGPTFVQLTGYSLVKLWLCDLCSSAILDIDVHTKFHQMLEERGMG